MNNNDFLAKSFKYQLSKSPISFVDVKTYIQPSSSNNSFHFLLVKFMIDDITLYWFTASPVDLNLSDITTFDKDIEKYIKYIFDDLFNFDFVSDQLISRTFFEQPDLIPTFGIEVALSQITSETCQNQTYLKPCLKIVSELDLNSLLNASEYINYKDRL